MARRYDHSQEEIVEMIIQNGHKIIKESGFSNFSTRKIARTIGYSVGTLYHILRSYDNIIFHINAVTLDEMKNFIKNNIKKTTNLNSQDEVIKYIQSLANLYIDFASTNYNSWSALFEFRPKENPPEIYTKKTNDLFLIIKDPLSHIMKNPEEIEDHIKILWASIHGICALNFSNKLGDNEINTDNRSSYAKSLASILINNFIKS
ncbi:MAG: hypothetical protein ACJAW3_000743 [Lentimonas sp.]|jgi:hypothetical protein